MKDLLLLSKHFETVVLPKEKNYFFKYFRTEQQRAALRYYYVFKDFEFFQDHTGIACTTNWLKSMRRRYERLERAVDKARQDFDLKLLSKINSGKIKFDKNDEIITEKIEDFYIF